MSMNGKREHFTLDDFKACAKTASMKRGMVEAIVDDVQQTVSLWEEFAEKVGIDGRKIERIRDTHQLSIN